MRSRSVVLVFAAAVVAVACTSSGGGAGVSSSHAAPASSVPVPSAPGEDDGEGHLEGFGDRLVAWHWSVEEYVARCMAAEGFEYVPWVPPVVREMAQDANQAGIEMIAEDGTEPTLRLPVSPIPPRPSEYDLFRRQAEESGFGIFFRVGVLDELPESAMQSEDPNLAIRAALDEATLEAYGLQLRECGSEAFEVLGLEPDPPGFEGVDDQRLYEAAEIVRELVEADARHQEALADYRSCMAERGYPVSDLQGAYDLVWGWFEDEVARAATAGRSVESFTEAGLAAAFGAQRLAELQAEERRVAVARVDCAQGLWEVEWVLLVEYERQVVADNPEVAVLLGDG